jgi:hypothetical protein
MTASNPDDDVLAAALIQIAGHAQRITDLDTREASHHADAERQAGRLSDRAEATSARLDTITTILGHHASIINAIDGIDSQVTTIAQQLADLAASSAAGKDTYEPAPQPRWWRLNEQELTAAVDRLAAWVEQVYRPGYGHLAAALPPCWARHPLCLYTLDWLSELWSALYLNPQRTATTLAAQAEWQTRLLPAAADQMAREATGCQHASGQIPRRPPPAWPGHPAPRN